MSQADLRFNDGSLARVGERATFQFVPNTRNFRLTNGTILLLIPPGRGRTNIQTPSAVTGIQGSAVVVRYIPESGLTLIMALTNNVAGPMTITTSNCANGGADACNASEHALYAGQMALIQNGQVQLVEFDLKTFYETSPLLEGMELDNASVESPLGAALEQVRQETLEALEEQLPFSEGMTLNPAMIGLGSTGQLTSQQPWLLSPSGNSASPLTTLTGVLTPGQSLVTNITQPLGEAPQPIPIPTQNPPSAVSTPGVGSSPSPVPTAPVSGGAGIGDGGIGGGGVDTGAGGGSGGGVGPGGNNGVGVGVGGDPGNNNGVGPGGNNGVGVGVGGDPGNNNGVGPGGNNGAGGGTDPFVPPNK
ncbi:FecR domain-containing protein [Nodosilinea sp. LEGE 07088]|nr:FecR domain-containing protein [Nodosilinea sp. LEGE 07088]